jgi:hypothetical protein
MQFVTRRRNAMPRDEVLEPELQTGTAVLVRTRFDGHWASGFEVADIRRRGAAPATYRIRRRSDRRVLPALFPSGQLRPAP